MNKIKKRNGLYKYCYNTGKLAFEEKFIDGKRNGLCKYYDPIGNLETVQIFKDDILVCEFRPITLDTQSMEKIIKYLEKFCRNLK